MKKKIFFILGVVLLVTGRLWAAQEMHLFALTADGEKSLVLTNVQKIVFENDAMTVNPKSGLDVTGATCVWFDLGDIATSLTQQVADGIFVFPNPVQSYLTVSGTTKDAKINLLGLNGALLQTVFAQDNATNIDVSALQQGTYLLQIANKTVKFIKQ